jgi:hypothetical protein
VTERSLPPGYGGEAGLERRLTALLAPGGTRETIGTSREGRPIHAYRWGADDAPAILLISLLHPMEWIGLEVHLAMLEDCLGGPAPAPPPAILSIPVANPDGFARVETALREGRPRWVRGNAARVDLNRNFPVGHRARPPFLDWWPLYRPGPAALSEPETAAIAAWIEGKTVRLSLSLHSFGRRVFVPPARRWRPLPGTASMRARARAAVAGSDYRAGPLGRWSPLFRASGTEIDFLHELTGAPAFLVEVSRGGFGLWGVRQSAQPFFLFNPPRPETEIARTLAVLRRLVESCVVAGPAGHGAVAGSSSA